MDSQTLQYLSSHPLIIYIATLLIVPGYIAIKTYGALTGNRKIHHNNVEFILTCFIWSIIVCFIALLINSLLKINNTIPLIEEINIATAFYLLFYNILLPLILSFILYAAREISIVQKFFGNQKLYAWDEIFKSSPKISRGCAIIATLNDGKKYAGLYTGKSFSTEGYRPKELYLSEQWELRSNGNFKKKTNQTAGVYLSDIKVVEFFELK